MPIISYLIDELVAHPGFKIPSPLLSSAAIKTAIDLKQWCEVPEHQAKAREFTSWLKGELAVCFRHSANAAQ